MAFPTLVEAARTLKHAAPREWAEFLDAFGRFTTEVGEAVADAEASNIMVMKGRALQCRALWRTLYECDTPKPTP